MTIDRLEAEWFCSDPEREAMDHEFNAHYDHVKFMYSEAEYPDHQDDYPVRPQDVYLHILPDEDCPECAKRLQNEIPF